MKKKWIAIVNRTEACIFDAEENLLLSAEPRMQGWVKSGIEDNLKNQSEWKPKDVAKLSDHELKVLFLGKEAVWPHPAPSQSNS